MYDFEDVYFITKIYRIGPQLFVYFSKLTDKSRNFRYSNRGED